MAMQTLSHGSGESESSLRRDLHQDVCQQIADGLFTAEDQALEDLQDLQQLGMQVRWPTGPSLAPGSKQAARGSGDLGREQELLHPMPRAEHNATVMETAETSAISTGDALLELRELHKTGLKVRWPMQ